MTMYENGKGLGGDGHSPTQDKDESARQAVQTSVDEAKEAADEAVNEARHTVDQLSSEASRLAGDARDKAMRFAEENKGRAAEQLSGITMALSKAADELENNDQRQIAGYARDLAGGLERFSTTLRDKGIDELTRSVGGFARQQPAVFLGAAALLGFAASRFAMSTAPKPAAGASRPASGDVDPARFGSMSGQPGMGTGMGPGDGAGATRDWSRPGTGGPVPEPPQTGGR